MSSRTRLDAETRRLRQSARREKNWQRWGPYLAERQWATVREDYSPDGDSWRYLPHDHARSRAYRWGEDGLLGLTDRECRLCFAIALWNERDPFLKERLFGLTGPQGNHGEDVKEEYFYLDSTPTHSYMKALYKYPQAQFPYARLIDENARRDRDDPEFEILDTGVFDDGRYFDVFAEYAKAAPDDILIRLTVANRGPDAAPLHLLPTLWYRNTWSFGCTHEGCTIKPRMTAECRTGVSPVERGTAFSSVIASSSSDPRQAGRLSYVACDHVTLGRFFFAVEEAVTAPDGARASPTPLFTDNETNVERLFGAANPGHYVKDAFHERVVGGRDDAVNPRHTGTKTAAWFRLVIPAGGAATVRLRLFAEDERPTQPFGAGFERVFAARIAEADAFYATRVPSTLSAAQRAVARQACAGLLWSKQFYHYVVNDWLDGDPGEPPPPERRKTGRNSDWRHLFNRDVISMPDKWEYPWYAAWDLAFHMIPFARLDPQFAKDQLVLLLREWYMRADGQIPAYEWNFADVNPPVHAWACWRVYKMSAPRGQRDRVFLSRVFQKLLINFTWWVNRKDPTGRHLFSGGFLGLDNIGVFDRSKPLPTGGHLEQADATAWMAFYCVTMLSMALELARTNPATEDIASKFFEHFVAISDSMNSLGGAGLWDEADGFYYDRILLPGGSIPLKVRSLVGLIPLIAAEAIDEEDIANLDGFKKRMNWFLEHRKDLARHISYMELDCPGGGGKHVHRLLAIPSRERLERVLRYLLDENEFLSPFGIRSVSRAHKENPYVLRADGQEHRVLYVPGESDSGLFGGNSNWRGPVWFPINFLLLEALERYHHFYGETLRVECPTGSGVTMNLKQVAEELCRRLTRLFLPDADGRRPCHGGEPRFAEDPHWRDLLLFHEYFHGDNGRGLGASHQTGWTALVVKCLEDLPGAR